MMDTAISLADLVMKWMVVPLLVAIGWLLKKFNAIEKAHQDQIATVKSDIRVLETKMEANVDASKSAYRKLEESVDRVLTKLDNIEQYLRERH